MILSRAKPASSDKKDGKKKKKPPKLETLVANRDYTGSLTLLEIMKQSGNNEEVENVNQWMAYAYFHLGDYEKALKLYQEEVEVEGADPLLNIFAGCCLFYLGMYQEAEEAALKGPECSLQNRLLFHIAHKFNDENKLMMYHQRLEDSIEDQLCLSSIHCLRSHYQEAIDIYKRILLDRRDYMALNVYVALCYYKLDYYDVSHEVLGVYLQQHADSAIALNLKACNHFRLYNGKAAEAEIKPLLDSSTTQSTAFELMRHNMVVFRNGENAMHVLKPLVDVIPEARLNLVIYHLRHGEEQDAYELMKDLEPTTPQEYILKGVVHAAIGQTTDSREHLRTAQQYFQLVGASASECDTIPGRQCMASCFYLLKQFEDALIYLNSIKSYFYNDSDFNWNLGMAKAALAQYEDAEETLSLIQEEKAKKEYSYLAWLARCHIMNGRARQAWELYLTMETSSESFNMLQLIANDAYKMGAFYYAAKAFDILERLDPNPEYWEGKRGACVGVFQQVIAGHESKDVLRDVVTMLRNANNPQVEYIVKTIKKWSKENGGTAGGAGMDHGDMARDAKSKLDEHSQHLHAMEVEKARQERDMKAKLEEKKARKQRG